MLKLGVRVREEAWAMSDAHARCVPVALTEDGTFDTEISVVTVSNTFIIDIASIKESLFRPESIRADTTNNDLFVTSQGPFRSAAKMLT